MTINQRIDGIVANFGEAGITDEDFAFLVERARKSVRVSTGKRGETKAHKEKMVIVNQIVEYMREKGEAVTAAEIEKKLEVSNQQATGFIRMGVNAGLIKMIEGQGKNANTYVLAEEGE